MRSISARCSYKIRLIYSYEGDRTRSAKFLIDYIYFLASGLVDSNEDDTILMRDFVGKYSYAIYGGLVSYTCPYP
jgi:hypothetical protein